jgi:hypothetical protein
MRNFAAILALLLALPGAVLAWSEPPRGSALRAALMDAARPLAESMLAAPVEFVVRDLRVEGDVAFASLVAQRPGGMPIDIRTTPGFYRGELDPEFMDGSTLQVLYQRVGGRWVPVHHAIGATDVWYADPAYCPTWGPVLPGGLCPAYPTK